MINLLPPWSYIQRTLYGNREIFEIFMFIMAQFATAKKQNQPICPQTDREIRKMWYSYTMEYYSSAKKSEIMKFLEN